MSISGISNSVSNYGVKDDSPSLKKAVKAYQDEMLTGLTDEEREEIKRRAKEYLEKNPIKTESDRNAFNDFIKSLLQKFGFKGDIDEYAVGMANAIQDSIDSSEEQQVQTNITEHFQKTSMDAVAIRNKLFQ